MSLYSAIFNKKPRPAWRRSITRIEEPAGTTAFKAKMEIEEAKQIYRQRSQIAEFPHAWIKQRCGLRQSRCRGREKTSMEATWTRLSHNIIRWFSILVHHYCGMPTRCTKSCQRGSERRRSNIGIVSSMIRKTRC